MAETQLEVFWAATALRDLKEIVAYISTDSPANARRILLKLRNSADNLKSMPHRGRVVPELCELSLEPWRELLVKPYRIIYRISGAQVMVVAVLDGRRDVEDILLRRLLRS